MAPTQPQVAGSTYVNPPAPEPRPRTAEAPTASEVADAQGASDEVRDSEGRTFDEWWDSLHPEQRQRITTAQRTWSRHTERCRLLMISYGVIWYDADRPRMRRLCQCGAARA